MTLEFNIEHGLQQPDKFVNPIANYQMANHDYVVRADPTAGNITITLPPVGECKGRFYSIVTIVATNAAIIADKNDSEYWPGDITITGAGDGVLAYSDGRMWTCFARLANAPS